MCGHGDTATEIWRPMPEGLGRRGASGKTRCAGTGMRMRRMRMEEDEEQEGVERRKGRRRKKEAKEKTKSSPGLRKIIPY